MEELLEAPTTEDWLSALHEEAAETRELYRDPAHGFLLLAHTEQAGLYRPPHDHGRGWVIYAVQRGETEMGTYRASTTPREVQLVKRETIVLRPGDVQVSCPATSTTRGASTGPLLLFRFTCCDLKKEDVTRYADPRGSR